MILIFLMRSPLKWNATQFRLSKTPEHSARYFFKPCLAHSVLSPALLACFHQFVQIRRWTYLENVAICQRRMLADELYSMIHVPRFKDENAAELFLGFGIGTICRYHFAVLPGQCQGGLLPLKRFSTSPVAAGAKMFVVCQAIVEHGVPIALRQAIEFAFVVVAQTDVFHCSSPPRWKSPAQPCADFSVTVLSSGAQHILMQKPSTQQALTVI